MKKKLVATLAIVLFFTFGIIQMANATKYNGIDFPAGATSFADEWVLYRPTTNVRPPYNNPASALGIPDYTSDKDAVSLGDEGVLVLKFTDNSLTTSGDNSKDLWIFEIGGAIEQTSVDISTNGKDWINVGETSRGNSGIDIDNYLSSGVSLGEKYSYVRLTDLLPRQSHGPFEGADIDAVGAIKSAAPVPIPGAVWLLGSGFVGLAGARIRGKRSKSSTT